MKTTLQKNQLKHGYYYSGYMHQHYCVISANQPTIVAQWDQYANCFWFWEYDENRKMKSKIPYLFDIQNEIECGFIPIKEVIPKEEHLIEI